MLAAYDVTRVISSRSARCVETVGPYSDTTGWGLELEDGLSEEGATSSSVADTIERLVSGDGSVVVCTHLAGAPRGLREPRCGGHEAGAGGAAGRPPASGQGDRYRTA